MISITDQEHVTLQKNFYEPDPLHTAQSFMPKRFFDLTISYELSTSKKIILHAAGQPPPRLEQCCTAAASSMQHAVIRHMQLTFQMDHCHTTNTYYTVVKIHNT